MTENKTMTDDELVKCCGEAIEAGWRDYVTESQVEAGLGAFWGGDSYAFREGTGCSHAFRDPTNEWHTYKNGEEQ